MIKGLSVNRVLGSDNWPDTVMDEHRRTGKGCSFIPHEDVFVAGLDGRPVINLGNCLQEFGNIGLAEIHLFSIQEALICAPFAINGNNLPAEESHSFQKRKEEIREETEAWVQSKYKDEIASMSKNGDGHDEKDVILPLSKSPEWDGHKSTRMEVRRILRTCT